MIYLLSHLIDRAADTDPGRDAFRVPGGGLTYGELVSQANRLARALVEGGTRRGDRVGVLTPRGLESAVAVYGILKAGAAFVPIDPYVPLGGLKRLLEDCGIRHLVTHPSQTKVLRQLCEQASGSGLELIVGLEEGFTEALEGKPRGGPRVLPWSSLDALPGGSGPDVLALEDDLAYLMYSSGSTGRPKGIMHTHRSGLSYAALSVGTYGVTAEDRIGNHSPLHFDMSTFGYFSSPYARATTLLVPEAYTKLTASLSQLMESERLTIWYSVPLALIQLLYRGVLDSRDLSTLRWVLFGGEPFARKHLRALMELWPGARFSNVYGPAEVNQCTFYHVPHLPTEGDSAAGDNIADDAESVPIGRIWGNTEGLIVDAGDRPVKDGQPGELLVRSATMMQGYWGRAERNARAFFERRAASGLKQLFYRTGDLVQVGVDGELLFLGRKDRQVKVRGYRIELDEIERTLVSHGEVEEAAVFPVRVGGEVEGLEAAVTLTAGATTQPEELRAFLGNLVSWYSVPARIAVLGSFPRTTSGKIKRRQLQEQAEARR